MAGHTREVWGDDEGAVLVEFDEQGRIAYKSWTDAADSFRAKLRRWIPWIQLA